MIGLFVLTALVLYIAFAIWIVKRQKTRKAKWISIAIFALIPTWNEILGKTYFYYLCSTRGGIKIEKTIELPREYWDADGRPKFITNNGRIEEKQLDTFLKFETHSEDESQSMLNIRKTTKSVIEKKSGQVAGTYTYFIHFSHGLIYGTVFHPTGKHCPIVEEVSFRDLVQSVLKPGN